MKKAFSFLVAILGYCSMVCAQTLPSDVVKLTPSSVTPVIDDDLHFNKFNALVVAGSPKNGYKAFFAAKQKETGTELWVTDGTAAGTHLVKDIYPGKTSSEIAWLTRFNDKVVFQATSDDAIGSELWISDGTEKGTYMVKDIHEFGSSNPKGFVQINETQFIFVARDLESEQYNPEKKEDWLWISDGTEEGTQLLYECDTRFPGKVFDNMSDGHFVRVGRKVFFKADDKDLKYGEELWITDGTREGTRLVKDINTEWMDKDHHEKGTANNALDYFTNIDNKGLYFKAFSDAHGNEPWYSDGTEQGTYEIKNVNTILNGVIAADGTPRDKDAGLSWPMYYKGRVYNRSLGNDGNGANDLYATDLTKGNYALVAAVNQVPDEKLGHQHSYPTNLYMTYDDCLWFSAQTGTDVAYSTSHAIEMFRYDGTEVKEIFGDFNPGVRRGGYREGMVASGSFYMTMQGGGETDNMQKIYRIDHKDDQPHLVADLTGSWAEADGVHSFRNCGGILVFVGKKPTVALYACSYKKPNYDPAVDKENLEIDFGTVTAIENVKRENILQLYLYPNPATEYIRFDVPGQVYGVTIIDLAGNVVKQLGAINQQQVDVADLAYGAYIVRVMTDKGMYQQTMIKK